MERLEGEELRSWPPAPAEDSHCGCTWATSASDDDPVSQRAAPRERPELAREDEDASALPRRSPCAWEYGESGTLASNV